MTCLFSLTQVSVNIPNKSFFIPKTLVLQKPALNVWSLNDVWLFGYSFHFWTIKNKTSHSLNTQFLSFVSTWLCISSVRASIPLIWWSRARSSGSEHINHTLCLQGAANEKSLCLKGGERGLNRLVADSKRMVAAQRQINDCVELWMRQSYSSKNDINRSTVRFKITVVLCSFFYLNAFDLWFL